MKRQTKKNIKRGIGLAIIAGSVVGFCMTFNPFFAMLHLAGWMLADQDKEEDVYRTTEYIRHK